MPTELPADPTPEYPGDFDGGLLSPVTVGYDDAVADNVVVRALGAAEIALVHAWVETGVAPHEVADEVREVFAWEPEDPLALRGLDAAERQELTRAAVAGGNPVIPLVGLLRTKVSERARPWVHRGATSQDILDTALVLVLREAGVALLADLVETDEALLEFAREHRDTVAAARTLTQHAVPTTVGLRAANWERGLARALAKLDDALWQLPAQLGGAAGTLAAFAQAAGDDVAIALPANFAGVLHLAVPEAPWHTQRWPITELGDALAQVLDALSVIAGDVATLSRTEIAELAEGAGGGSSAMPQKQNPAKSVLIRSAAIRAPHLAATLHAAAALANDERPDGAWHAEWPTIRELMRLALGAAGNARELVRGLRVNRAAVDRNLGLTHGLIVSERIVTVLTPIIGAERSKGIIQAAGNGADLAELLRAEQDLADAGVDIDALCDPAEYTGLAQHLTDLATNDSGTNLSDTNLSSTEEPA